MNLNLRKKEECRFDMISLGEIMLRLDPGEGRIKTARSFRAWEGGGEYNVARGLRRCFGMKTAVVTAFADNEVGRLLEDFIMQGGVDTSLIKWVKYDGIGRTVRNGLNFTERGFGIRGAVGVSDRGNTAISQLKAGDIDWEYIFGTLGVRWLHTGGIFAALSESTAEVAIEAVKTAKKYGTIVSYDLNYRPSLWNDIGGKAKAQEVNKEIAKYIDEAYDKPLTLSTLAARFGYSPNYFSWLFKQHFKTSFPQYLNRIRVRKSLPLLRTKKVYAVCYECGFNSPQQYYLHFKKFYGCSPK